MIILPAELLRAAGLRVAAAPARQLAPAAAGGRFTRSCFHCRSAATAFHSPVFLRNKSELHACARAFTTVNPSFPTGSALSARSPRLCPQNARPSSGGANQASFKTPVSWDTGSAEAASGTDGERAGLRKPAAAAGAPGISPSPTFFPGRPDVGEATHFRSSRQREESRRAAAESPPGGKADSQPAGEAKSPAGSAAAGSAAAGPPAVVGPHPAPSSRDHLLPHPVWSAEEVQAVRVTHQHPEVLADYMALAAVRGARLVFDVLSGYAFGYMDERHWLNRIVFLETVAGVPGMVGAMIRHLNSLRRMQRDYGWIHTLLEEAENERMHLMTALVLKKPSALFRLGVLVAQGVFLTGFAASYLVSNRFAHRFVGYLEEEAVKTYTHLLKEIDSGHLPLFVGLPAPRVSKMYWGLPADATFRDVVLAIRADESHHREVNHTFAAMRPDDCNPFPPGH